MYLLYIIKYIITIAVSKAEGIRMRKEAASLTNFKVPGTTMEIKPQAFPTLTGQHLFSYFIHIFFYYRHEFLYYM